MPTARQASCSLRTLGRISSTKSQRSCSSQGLPCSLASRPISPSGWAQPCCRSMMMQRRPARVEGRFLGLGDELVVGIVGHIVGPPFRPGCQFKQCRSVRGPLLGRHFVMVAGDEVAGADGARARAARAADFRRHRAAGVEVAARRRVPTARAVRRGWRLRPSGSADRAAVPRAAGPACRDGAAARRSRDAVRPRRCDRDTSRRPACSDTARR